jgi:serine/threonine protein kinase
MNDGSMVDVTKVTFCRLMSFQGQCGKPNYISPEVVLNMESFDGFAADLWACGIILFIMLVGMPASLAIAL